MAELKVTKWYRLFICASIWIGDKQWLESRAGSEVRPEKKWAGHDFLDTRGSGRRKFSIFFTTANTANCFCCPAILVHDPKWLTDPKLILISLNSPLHVDFKWCKTQNERCIFLIFCTPLCMQCLALFWSVLITDNPHPKGWWCLKRCKNRVSKKRDYFRVMTWATWHHGSWRVLIGFSATCAASLIRDPWHWGAGGRSQGHLNVLSHFDITGGDTWQGLAPSQWC